jgi:hypothetical protein
MLIAGTCGGPFCARETFGFIVPWFENRLEDQSRWSFFIWRSERNLIVQYLNKVALRRRQQDRAWVVCGQVTTLAALRRR